VADSDALPLEVRFSYETHNAPVYKFTDIATSTANYSASTYKISAKSDNTRPSYWWLNKFSRQVFQGTDNFVRELGVTTPNLGGHRPIVGAPKFV